MNALTILNHSVRTSDNLFSLNDLHKASGGESKHAPFRFMRNEQTSELVAEIERSPDLVIGSKVIRGGSKQGTWVCKELVYAYAMWISAKFHLQVIRAFDSLVSQPLTLTSAQKLEIRKAVGRKAQNDGESHKKVYRALYDHFSVSEYGHIPEAQFDEAIQFIQSLDITPGITQQNQVPPYSTRLMLVIENGNVVSTMQGPDNAFVSSKENLVNLLNEPSLFTFDEMAKIAQVAQSRMVDLVRGLPAGLPGRNW